MARIINTREIDPRSDPLLADPDLREWIYNGLDCVVTRHVHDSLKPLVEQEGHAIPYRFVRAMQGPAMDMMRRGILVQPVERQRAITFYEAKRKRYDALLQRIANAVWGRDLNPGSSKQMCAFFFTALKLPVQYTIRKTPQGKVRTPSCDHGALEAMAKMEVKGPGISPYDRSVEKVRIAAPIVTLILALRDCDKKLTVLRKMGTRFRCGYAVAGPKTARWASYANAFGEGDNLQNVTPEMRRPCIADDGWKLGSPDYEQAESRLVAGLVWQATGDDGYWKACESGDLHTIVACMAWPEVFNEFGHWDARAGVFVGDLKAARRKAETRYYRHLTYRDIAKRVGHGSNYYGTPFGIAGMIGNIETRIVQDFQNRYFRAFPAIRTWHMMLIRQFQMTNELWTPLGRKRVLFGRTSENATINEAVAHIPQSTIGELLNCALYRVWRYGIDGGTVTTPNGQVFPFRRVCQLLLQVHDSITFQWPDRPDIEAAVIAKAAELMSIPIPITRPASEDGSRPAETRMLTIPLEWKTGWNWAHKDDKRETFADGNPDGQDKWRGPNSDSRKRTTPAKPTLNDWL